MEQYLLKDMISRFWFDFFDFVFWLVGKYKRIGLGEHSSFKCFLNFLLFLFVYLFWLCHKACEILVPQPGIKPIPPALEAQILTTELPGKSCIPLK